MTSYRVYRGEAQIATATTTSYSDTGLSPSTTYSYTVAAFDAAGNGSARSSPASATSLAPPDTTPPSLTITSPANGSTVSGTIKVTANASDDRGVMGVQFKLDGTNLGAEERQVPYEMTWDTTTASNRAYTLTAVARDAAGNQAISAGITVNVSNAPPPPPPPDTTPPTVTRFEESAASFTGTGWVQRGPDIAAFSGGTAASSSVAGDTARFTFTGTAVSWIGLKCNACGIASVSIDNGVPTTVDTAGPTAPRTPGLTSEVVFTSATLAPGSHTMVITVTGSTTSANTHIVVDAFVVTGAGSGAPTTATRIEETDPSISYTGTWISFTDPRVSGGSVVEAFGAGDRATLSFAGTAVSWIGARGSFGGIARVSVDGIPKGEVDTYAPSVEAQVVVFTAAGLPRGPHTLTIEVTGTNNRLAELTGIVVDAFDVTP